MSRQTVTNFSRGEFGPELYGRTDIPQYGAGAKELNNFLIQRYGGASFRPGFRFVGEVDDPDVTYRYLPFQFSVEQAYVMVLGDSLLQLLAEGGFVTNDDLEIISVVKGVTTMLEVNFHDNVVGNRIYLDGITGMTELNGRFVTVLSVPDANHFEIDVDSTSFANFISSTGIDRTGAPAPPPAPEPPPPLPPPPPPPPTTTGGGGGAASGGGSGTFDGGFGAFGPGRL